MAEAIWVFVIISRDSSKTRLLRKFKSCCPSAEISSLFSVWFKQIGISNNSLSAIEPKYLTSLFSLLSYIMINFVSSNVTFES